MKEMEPLTPDEQKMAEDYFHLVDKFLRKKRLDPGEYFDVAIFGYLQAVQRECRNPNPPEKKNIYGLIEVCMERAVLQEWRSQYRDKRQGDHGSLSLDYIPAHTDDGEFSLYDVVADIRQKTEFQVEAKDLAKRALAVATLREREVIGLACLGYEAREIAQMLGIARNTAYRTLCNFRAKAKAVRDDREVIRCPQWVKNKEQIQARNRAYWAANKDEINARRAAKRAEKLVEVQV